MITFRPLPIWPYPETPNRRSRYIMRASYQDTLGLLERELGYLGADAALLAAGFREGDIRRDGYPRSDARQPSHPGVELSFDSPHGRLVYRTDAYEIWQHNVRAITLGLEALRAVDRYGITSSGEQYAGWLQLGTTEDPATRGRELVGAAGGNVADALRRAHPDHGGTPADLAAVQAYRRSIPALAGG